MKIKNKETGLFEDWHHYPATDIDYTKLKLGIKELPVFSYETGRTFSVNSGLAFRINNLYPEYIQVLRLSNSNLHYRESQTIEYSRYFSFRLGTKLEVAQELIRLATRTHTRVRLDYGDVNTLKSWNETFEVEGRLFGSSGKAKRILLSHNVNSTGGATILTDCILSIRESKKRNGRYRYFYRLEELFTNPLKKITEEVW